MSRGLGMHSTIFGFNRESRQALAQSWGAHIFVDGTVKYFFDPTRELYDDEMILIDCKYFLFFAVLNTGFRSLLVVLHCKHIYMGCLG